MCTCVVWCILYLHRLRWWCGPKSQSPVPDPNSQLPHQAANNTAHTDMMTSDHAAPFPSGCTTVPAGQATTLRACASTCHATHRMHSALAMPPGKAASAVPERTDPCCRCAASAAGEPKRHGTGQSDLAMPDPSSSWPSGLDDESGTGLQEAAGGLQEVPTPKRLKSLNPRTGPGHVPFTLPLGPDERDGSLLFSRGLGGLKQH